MNKIKFKFSILQDGFSSLLGSSVTIFGGINCSPEWAARLVLFNDEATQNAFAMTIGHELTHLEGEFCKKGLHGEDKKFQSWLDEVHADFGSAEKMVDCDRNKLMESIEYKLNLKKKDKDANSHPSWRRRKYYAEHYDFDKKLIKKIANDVGCKNEGLIGEAIKFYGKDNILLNPKPIIKTK